MNDVIVRQLTAYLDGELSAAECDAVNRLLSDSPEARVLLRALQRDQQRMRALMRENAPVDFAALVLERVVRRRPVRGSARLVWLPRAVAASLVIGMGLGTFLVVREFAIERQPGVLVEVDKSGAGGALLAKDEPGKIRPADPHSAQAALQEFRAKLPSLGELSEMTAQLRDGFAPVLEGMTRLYGSGRDTLAGAFEREPLGDENTIDGGNPTYLTSQLHPSKAFKTVEVSKLPLFDIKELEAPTLVARLRTDSVHHFDLSCRESWKALERLQTACRAAGVKLLIDSEVTLRVNQKTPSAYMIYLDNVPAELVARVLENLKVEERRLELQKKGDAQFSSLLVLPVDQAGRKRLAISLGVSPSSLQPAKAKKPGQPVKLDPTRPLAKDTEKALDKLAAGQGPRTAPREPTAVVLVAVPNRDRVPPSKEVKAYLDARTAGEPAHVNIVFFLRPSKG